MFGALMTPAVGTQAPDFELPLKVGEAPLRLADYQGEKSVVLLFFPLAFSSTCTEEVRYFAEHYSTWRDLSAEVIAISVDSAFVNQRFALDCNADFPILSDFNKDVARAYGVLYEEFMGMKGVSKRAAFVVDRSGVVAFSWVSEDPGLLPPFEEIRDAVSAAS
jgi:peroxiredoxin